MTRPSLPDRHQLLRRAVEIYGPNPPEKGQSVAVAIGCEKTAALAYDRVWSPFKSAVPQSVRISGLIEIDKSEMTLLESMIQRGLVKDEEDLVAWVEELVLMPIPRDPMTLEQEGAHHYFVRTATAALQVEAGIRGVPFYPSERDLRSAYSLGDHSVIMALLQTAVPDEVELEWEQVLEFRRDVDSVIKYRRLCHWLDAEFVGRPLSFIEDEISLRVLDYEAALARHGLASKAGYLLDVVSEASALGAAGAAAAVALGGGPWEALLSGVVVLGGRAAAKLMLTSVDREELCHEHREVAFVHEVSRLSRS